MNLSPEKGASPLPWLLLWRTPGVGARLFSRLLEQFGTPEAIFDAGREQLRSTGVTRSDTLEYLRNPDQKSVEPDLRWLEQPDSHLLTLHCTNYPPLLRQIPDPPPLLFVKGDPALLGTPQLAVVGSRNPTPGGSEIAFDFARHLSACGLTVTSGMALGIDAAAHRGALQEGSTIAVMGTGLDRVYPASHRELAHEIAERGALVSEFPIGTLPTKANFPRRNRIIAGLTLGTLVVEAAMHSGSLITARLAGEQGREVFAIPGSIHNPLARGCHRLIREGAKLVETGDDILEELAGVIPSVMESRHAAEQPATAAVELDREYTRLLEIMGHDPVTVDTLVDRSGLTTEEVSSMLLVLELQDHVASMPGGLYSRVEKRT